ncbi:MAG: hypothetical protein M1459_01245 [Patescibacteria group bacterium]|nr:hypothetical protein [Patescibacteria group bacterium]
MKARLLVPEDIKPLLGGKLVARLHTTGGRWWLAGEVSFVEVTVHSELVLCLSSFIRLGYHNRNINGIYPDVFVVFRPIANSLGYDNRPFHLKDSVVIETAEGVVNIHSQGGNVIISAREIDVSWFEYWSHS